MRARWVVVCLALVSTGCQQVTVTPTSEGSAADRVPPATVAAPEPTPRPTATMPPTPTPTPTPIPTPTVPPAERLDAAFAMSSLDESECPREAKAAGVTCYVARVPLRAEEPDPAEMVELAVAFVDNGDPSGIGPVIFLQGGPGIGSVGLAPDFVGAAHDLMLFDQRGAGLSVPKLDCVESDELWLPNHTDDDSRRIDPDAEETYDALAECRDRLVAEGVDLDAFHTTAVAADIELLRRLFAFDQWSIWGISYGTRVGLTVLRDYPEGVRAAVLDSVLPFEVDFFATIPVNGLRAIEALDAACDADQCATDHGDFLAALAALARQVEADPIAVEVTRPVSGTTYPFRVDGAELIDIVFGQLYSTRALPSLPRQVARAESGGFEELVRAYVSNRDPEGFDLAEGLYYTTWCREEFPFHDSTLDDPTLARGAEQFGDGFARSLSSDGIERICEIFDVAPGPVVEDQSLSSDVPTLFFAGAFDPITPPSWTRQVADSFSASVFVELADHGHGMSTRCPALIRRAFLIDPAAELDVSCAAEAIGPDFN